MHSSDQLPTQVPPLRYSQACQVRLDELEIAGEEVDKAEIRRQDVLYTWLKHLEHHGLVAVAQHSSMHL